MRLTPDELHEHIDQPTHLAGAFEPRTATVHPAHLVRGLRRVALERGVRIYENSPMLSLRRAGRPRVRTPDGEITAGTTALALNAWAAAIPELSRAIVPVTSDLVATAPDHALLERMRWTRAEAIADARLMVHYYQATRDGRIVFGKGGGSLAYNAKIGDDFNHAPRRSAWVAQHMHRILPATVGAEITHTWSGPVARTDDGLPIFGRLADNVVHGGGYSGNSVGPSWVGGRILASLALGRATSGRTPALCASPARRSRPSRSATSAGGSSGRRFARWRRPRIGATNPAGSRSTWPGLPPPDTPAAAAAPGASSDTRGHRGGNGPGPG